MASKFRFNQPVLVNVARLVAKVIAASNLRGVTKANIGVKLEIDGTRSLPLKAR